jgi:hypothetical protein
VRWLLVISIAVAGCRDREAARLTQIKDAVCACKTSSCAELAMKDVPQDEAKPSHRSQVIARDMMECLSKLYEAERPTTDPDAPTP